MKKYLFLLLAVVFIGCEKDPSGIVDTTNEDFQTLNVSAPMAVNLHGADTSFSVSVKIKSTSELNSVFCNIFYSDGAQMNDYPVTLWDNGQASNGDTASGDNVYSGKITISSDELSDFYRINFYLKSYVSGERIIAVHNFSFDNGKPNSKPKLSRLIAPDTVRTATGGLMYLSVKATDLNGKRDIRRVVFQTFRPDNTTSGAINEMLDNGDINSNGDTTAVDGIFTYIARVTSVPQVGNWTVKFLAYDRKGLSSDTLTHKIYIR